MQMIDLATTWMYATIAVFALGAATALLWSIASGQWKHLDEAALIPLEDEYDPSKDDTIANGPAGGAGTRRAAR
jgi:nitrogen fixation-related uncharacterized protein